MQAKDTTLRKGRAVAGRVNRKARTAVRQWLDEPAATEAPPVEAEADEQVDATTVLDLYTTEPPSPQLAIDIFAGDWSSKFPDEFGITAGAADLFEDARITWLLELLGDVKGARVLELGPLEGGHTAMLDRAGAQVTAIESNSRAFLKCLVAKEVVGMTSARFLRGDFTAYLEQSTDTFDFIVASGVLYHMKDPFRLLDLMAARSDRMLLWTHYYDRDLLEAGGHGQRFEGAATDKVVHGTTYRLHPREYRDALGWGGFCGGNSESMNWIERADLLGYLGQLGYDRIEINFDSPDHINGPALALFAERTASAPPAGTTDGLAPAP